MKIVKKFISTFLSVMLLGSVLAPLGVYADTPNLIANPSVETQTGSLPQNWTSTHWGTNTATFAYENTGHTGSHDLLVTVSGYSSGDAKWQADPVAVTAGQTYIYSDYNKSSVVTELDAAYTNAAGTTSYAYLQSVPASATWQQTTSTFTVPAGMVSVSIYHIIYSNGTLQTDDFSLTAQSTTPPVPDPVPPVTGNLIANSSFETANGTSPASWSHDSWGTNAPVFTYTTGDAHTGTRSATVSATSMTSGDAKWYANPVAVTAGTTYTYQDYYKSTVVTRVVVAMTNASGVDSYVELATAPAATAWTPYNADVTVPSGIKTVTIYHLLDKVGTLSIDDVSLIAGTTTTPPSNFIPNPSFETASGALPASWQKSSWGVNTAKFTYVANDGHAGTHSAKVTISGYSSGDAKWAFTPITTLTPGSQYKLSAWYKTNTQPKVVADYVDANGVDQYLELPNPLPAANATTVWQQYTATLDVPAGAKSMTIFMLINRNGWLQTDDFSLTSYAPVGFSAPMVSLTFDDGWSSIYTNGLPLLQKYGFVSTQYIISGKLNTTNYMTTAMVQAFKDAGSEIGSHTVTHPDLTTLTSANLKTELSTSKSALQTLFGTDTALDFASPYGSYNATVLNAIKQYYRSHRSTDVGFNSKDTFNPYNILVQNVDSDTTPAEVAAWVAKAKADNTWLVLVFHEVTDSTNTDDYSVTPADLDTELANIKASGIAVETVGQALAAIQSQL